MHGSDVALSEHAYDIRDDMGHPPPAGAGGVGMRAPRATLPPAVGQVWQIDPAVEMFGGCFLIVSEVKTWGVQGYVRVPGGGDAFVRKEWDALTFIGVAEWAHADETEVSA